jgi:hypothetical protein
MILFFAIALTVYWQSEAIAEPSPLASQTAKPANAPSALSPSIGLNTFDLVRQYLGRPASDGTPDKVFQKVSQALARKAMVDAHNIGVTYFRVGITGIAPRTVKAPGELDLWMQDRPQYWALIDQMMTDLQTNGLHIIPVFLSQAAQFPSMTGDSSYQMLTDPHSKSYKLMEEYVTEFVERYRANPVLYFYELTSELNLAADIDEERRYRTGLSHGAAGSAPGGNISTAQLIAFTQRLAACIRKLDKSHLISSGFAIPRANAEHLRATPEFVNLSARRPADSLTEFKKNLRDIHEGLDIVSVHLYNQRDNERFGIKGHQNADLLGVIKQATDEMGKLLFVGEFADKDPTVSEDPSAPYTQAMLEKIAELRIPFSAPWCWEFYHRPPKPGDMGREDTSLEPGLTDLVISKIVAANKTLGTPRARAETSESRIPEIIVYYPLDGAKLAFPKQAVYVVASGGLGISKVDLLLDEKIVATLTQAPFKFELQTAELRPGPHQITARAYDPSDNVAEYRVEVMQAATAPPPPAPDSPRGD